MFPKAVALSSAMIFWYQFPKCREKILEKKVKSGLLGLRTNGQNLYGALQEGGAPGFCAIPGEGGTKSCVPNSQGQQLVSSMPPKTSTFKRGSSGVLHTYVWYEAVIQCVERKSPDFSLTLDVCQVSQQMSPLRVDSISECKPKWFFQSPV